MTQIQRALEKLLKLHGVKLERDITATVDSSDLSKIGKVVEEALKLYKTCGNASGQVEDKLQQIKDDLVNEIEKKRNEPTKFSAADLEGFKRDVLNGVSSDVEAARKAIDGFESKLESTNDRLERVTKKVGGVDDDSTISPTGGEFARNCKEVLTKGNTKSGIYTIRPPRASQPFKVQCDMDTRGGGWTYVMRRFDGSQDFYLNWTDYKDGFGNLEGEFWLGLKHLHELTGNFDLSWSCDGSGLCRYQTQRIVVRAYRLGRQNRVFPFQKIQRWKRRGELFDKGHPRVQWRRWSLFHESPQLEI